MQHARLPFLLLSICLVVALFPFGWLAQNSAAAHLVLATLFPTEVAHAVGHTLIFGLLGATLLTCFPPLQRQPGRYLGLILVVALAQEGFQLLSKGRGLILNDFTDLGTDMVAAGLVIALWYNWTQRRRRAK